MYNTRFYIMKKIYPNHLLLFKTNKNKLGLRCYGYDRYILDQIRKYTSNQHLVLNRLEKANISYHIIDNLEIIKSYQAEKNQYTTYLYRFICIDIINRIRVSVLG